MFCFIMGLVRRAALTGVCLLMAVAFTGCQGAQTTPVAQPTAASSSSPSASQLFGGQLPAGLPLDPASGFGSVEVIQGTTMTLTAGRAGFPAGQAPDSQTPRARGQGGQTPQAQGQPDQGGPFQGGQGQRGQGGQGLGALGTGGASLVSLTPDTKYFKGVSAAPSGTPGAQGARPPGTPQPGGGQQDTVPLGPGGTPESGGPRGDRQLTVTIEPGTVADVQAGSMVMVWGSVIDGRVWADVVYILSAGPGR
jgi:hypothetical protein